MSVRLRYAPSPTGYLHIGGARTALFNYLYAKNQGGTFILRIEDTDIERNVNQAAEEFADGLRWLGIHWDEGVFAGGEYGPYYCMERMHIYPSYVDMLREKGLAYDCYCSEEDLAAEREASLAAGNMPQYSGRCRHLTDEQREAFKREGRKPTVRFRVPDDRTVRFTDLIRGELVFEPHSAGGDFVIVKSNGIPTYNFACTVDDHLMEITHVIRGEEHISNTPRQLHIYEAFGWEPPAFGHVSLILGPNGKKLSKRDGSIMQFIEQYRDQGYLPEAVFNFLALLGWSPGGEKEILSVDELVRAFSLDRVNKSGAFFDAARLAWMNSHYIKERSVEELLPLTRPHLQPFVEHASFAIDDAWISGLVALYQDKVSCLSEIPVLGKTFLVDSVSYETDAAECLKQSHVPEVLSELAKQAGELESWTVDSLKGLLKAVQKESGYKGKDLFMPVRAAVMGQLHGPDLNGSLALLAKERVLDRLKQALALVHEME